MDVAKRDDNPGFWVRDFEGISEAENYLGDPVVIDALIRNFLVEALDYRDNAFMTGEDQTEDMGQWLRDHAETYGGYLLGRGNDYRKISEEWNSPTGGIIDNVRRRYDLKPGDPMAVMAIPFLQCMKGVLMAEELDANGDEWDHIIEGEIELAVATLLGNDEQLFPFEA